MRYDRIFTNARLARMTPGAGPYGAMEDAALAVRDGRIAWIGSASEASDDAYEIIDLDGCWVTPALVDCHTHLLFEGDRSEEFERRLAGESYEDISRGGGGIAATVEAVRAAGAPELASSALARLDDWSAEGVATVEIKTGYGLDYASELDMLKAARVVGLASGLRVSVTLLAAHAVPPDYAGRSGAYVEEVALPLITEAAREGLADAVDAYCERIAFSVDETRLVFERARACGLPVKLHADQFSDMGGAALAAEFGALSADHLEYASPEGIQALAKAGSVGVLLPGAFYGLSETQPPPIEAMRAHGLPMAVATDSNPGSSPLVSLLTAANMACLLFGLTPAEALAGITREGARALGLGHEIGTLETGKRADLAVWDVQRPAEIIQWLGRRPLQGRIIAGEWA